jgi:hypothetical protein
MKLRIKFITDLIRTVITGIILIGFPCCTGNPSIDNQNVSYPALSKEKFSSVPDSDRLWVYYYWEKVNITRECITNDLEAMKKKGIGGFLLCDVRTNGYMSPEWREIVKYTMHESARLGLEMSINLSNSGIDLRGAWDMGKDGPKKLIWTSKTVHGPAKISELLNTPENTRYYQDVSLIAVKLKSNEVSPGDNSPVDLNGKWNEIAEPGKDATVAEKIIYLRKELKNGQFQWDVPEGEWKIVRFGYTVIGDKESVDILNKEAVKKYFNLMGTEILNDAGPLAGKTLKYFYNVSWEGSEPNWTPGFEQEFVRFRGYEIGDYMPVLAGVIVNDHSLSKRFLRDYYRTCSDCFLENCYKTIGQLCHERGMKWHSENGGPWRIHSAMFKEADCLTFLGVNDIPQGEFWSASPYRPETSNARYTSMAAHIYGKPLISMEAFTSMMIHWTEYPGFLKPYADKNFIDGSNMFIWHTYTASPPEMGIPGYEYFAGTHFNPRVTWWEMSGDFVTYLGRCQHMLRQGIFVADVCSYVSDKNYHIQKWTRATEWNNESTLRLNPGYTFDLLNTDVLVNRLSVKDGTLVLPDGMNYKLLVVDLHDQSVPTEALKKIIELAKNGATVVLGQNKPNRTPGLKNHPVCDREVVRLSDELWGKNIGASTCRRFGKGMVINGIPMEDVLKKNGILPDFEGPFEYIHRNNGKQDIYFLRGTGKADCAFRITGKKPEVWDPVSGSVSDILSYHFTADNRTVVAVDLPENGSTFVVFSDKKEKNYFTSITGPDDGLEIKERSGDTLKIVLWKSGDYRLTDSQKKTWEINKQDEPALELSGPWNVSFTPGWGAPERITFMDLIQWNNHPDKGIKYYSGTGTYQKIFNLSAEQAESPVRLQLGKVFNIARVRMNGKDMGVVWTAPWTVDLSEAIKPGENELEIEIANCWINRLIGDAGLPESKRVAKTNILLLSENEKYTRYTIVSGKKVPIPDAEIEKLWHSMYISAKDTLHPSGLIGPVRVEFGEKQEIIL